MKHNTVVDLLSVYRVTCDCGINRTFSTYLGALEFAKSHKQSYHELAPLYPIKKTNVNYKEIF